MGKHSGKSMGGGATSHYFIVIVVVVVMGHHTNWREIGASSYQWPGDREKKEML